MSAPLIHICGWPGSGKRTIARHLADLIGGKVIHNHLMLDPAGALFDRGTPDHSVLREEVRGVIYRAALTMPPDVPLIVTDALAASDAVSPLITSTLTLAVQRDSDVIPIVLDISAAENARRLTDPSRIGSGKLTDRAVLQSLRDAHALLHLPGAIVFDVTDLSAEQAAHLIADALKGTTE